MSDGRVICVKPKTKTITRILRFEDMEDSIENAILSSMGTLKVHSSVVSKLEEKNDNTFDEKYAYVDGVIQDLSTGEFFYFLAIQDREVDISLIDEGSIVAYEKEYRGIAEISLYKGNTGHTDAQIELLYNYYSARKEVPQADKDDSQSMLNSLREGNKIENDDSNNIMPVKTESEIVRYVEIERVISV